MVSYSIREVAKMMGVTPSTLRYYDQEGLLPNIKRKNGVRVFEKEDFSKIALDDYVSYKKGKYQYEVLIRDKNVFKKKYGITSIDKPSIDDIMLFYIKGER